MSTRMGINPSRDPQGSISDDEDSAPKRGAKAAAQKSQVRRGEAEMRRVSEAWCEVRVQGTESYQQYFTLLPYNSVLHAPDAVLHSLFLADLVFYHSRKDKTLVYVLDSLQKIEAKLEQLMVKQTQQTQLNEATASSLSRTTIPQARMATQQTPIGKSVNPYMQMDSSYCSMSPQAAATSTYGTAMSTESSMVGSSMDDMTPQAIMGGRNQRESRQCIEARKILTWPSIRQMLTEFNIDLDIMNTQYMPAEKWLTIISQDFADDLAGEKQISFINTKNPGPAQGNSSAIFITFPIIQEYTSLYFASYHYLYPILDEDHFRNETFESASYTKFDKSDHNTTLLLLVMGLGEVAKKAISGEPMVDPTTGQPTGVRGGDKTHPPGAAFIHEARNRIGQGITKLDRTVLHCFLLFSLYYAQVSRNMDYWRMTKMASELCYSLVKCVDDDQWKTFNGDMLSRAYWMCIVLEGGLVSELGLQPSLIQELVVPLPEFIKSAYPPRRAPNAMDMRVKFTFLAQATLRAQLNRVDESVRPLDGSYASMRENFPTRTVTDALLTSLQEWRRVVPSDIKWDDSTPPQTPEPSAQSSISQYPPVPTPHDPAIHRQNLEHLRTFWSFSNPYHQMKRIILPPNSTHFMNVDLVLDASLRTRYKYVKYLIWRPYLYKVLHSGSNITVSASSPDKKSGFGKSDNPVAFPYVASSKNMDIPITVEDVIGGLAALKNCTLWYLMHPVFKDQRRLLPHLYEYSHSMFGILLLFIAAERSSVLVCAFEAAERGPAPPVFGAPSPYSPAYPSSSSTPSLRDSAFGVQQPTNTFQVLQKEIERLGAEGQLEEYRYLREQMEISKECFLGWMRDMQVVHPIANWCWGTLKRVYKL